MKKKLGVLVLTLSSLVITAACASSSPATKTKPPEPDPGETWSQAGPSELPSFRLLTEGCRCLHFLLQIINVLQIGFRFQLEHQPTDVRKKQAPGDTIGVVIMIHMLMVIPMFGSPPEDGTLKGRGSKDDGK